MVIQHNLQSSFTSMQIGQTERSRAKTQEKLASGYKINRASDNAAGLEISEKMRRQIRGLTRAAVNGKDGISFVQIADGALEEVHDMLQRGNELAVQAANGTNSASDREAINNEIIELKKEIDRVAETSKFNEIKIFSKQGMLPPTTITDAEIEEKAIKSELDKLADKVAEEYFPNAVKQILDKMPWFNEIIQEGIKNNPNLYDTTLKVVYIDGKGGKAGATMGAGFTWPEQKFEAGSLVMSIDKDDYPSLNMYPSTLSYFEGTVAHETMHGMMDIAFPNRMYRVSQPEDFPGWFVEGTAQLTSGDEQQNRVLKRLGNDLESEEDSSKDADIISYLSQGGEYTVDNRVYGHGYLAVLYACYLAADGNDVTQENLLNGAGNMFRSLRENYDDSFGDVMQSVTGISVSDLKDAINSGSTTELVSGKDSAVEFIRKYLYKSKGGVGSLITDDLNTGGLNILGNTAKKEDQPLRITTIVTAYQEVKSDDDTDDDQSKLSKGRFASISLHLGTDADMTNKIMVLQYDMSSDALGLTDTNVLSADNATNAINDFGKAIMKVSSVRSYFGAVQNRLEHTIKNLDNIVENTTSAESRLRDADIADEMVRLSTFNIIQQAGNAMLTQANQTPQGDLKLLQ